MVLAYIAAAIFMIIAMNAETLEQHQDVGQLNSKIRSYMLGTGHKFLRRRMTHTFLSMSCLSFSELRILFDTSSSTSSKSLRTVSSCCNVSTCNSRNFASTFTLNFRCARSSTSLSKASIFISISFTIWSCSYSFLWGKQQKRVIYSLILFYHKYYTIILLH